MSRQMHTEYLSWDQMTALSTERLLAYRKSLLALPEWRQSDDIGTAAWWWAEHARALEQSKVLLNKREHIAKKS